MKKKTVFLDFDGVCHPINKDDFSSLKWLKELFKDYRFDIVISSDWQLSFEKHKLENFLQLPIKGEIYKNENGDCCYYYKSRAKSILEYIKREKLEIKNCLILDDNIDLFPEFLKNEENYENEYYLDNINNINKLKEKFYLVNNGLKYSDFIILNEKLNK